MVVAVCYLFLLNFPIYSATDSPKLQDVLLALKKMVSYYKDTHRDMNLDGIYGLRVLEGRSISLQLHIGKKRKSSRVNARGIPTVAYQVLHMLSYPGGGYLPWRGGGVGTSGYPLSLPSVLTWLGGGGGGVGSLGYPPCPDLARGGVTDLGLGG